MIRWPNPGRHVLAIMAAGALCITLTGCPPRKPTPVAAPAGNWIGDSTLVAIRDSSLVGRISYLVILGAHRDTAASRDTLPAHMSRACTDVETAGSPTRRRAQAWCSLFIAPCALSVTPCTSAASTNVTRFIQRVVDLHERRFTTTGQDRGRGRSAR